MESYMDRGLSSCDEWTQICAAVLWRRGQGIAPFVQRLLYSTRYMILHDTAITSILRSDSIKFKIYDLCFSLPFWSQPTFMFFYINYLTPIRQMALNCSNMVPYGTMFALCSIEHGPIWDHVGLKFDLNLVKRNLTDINGVLTKSRL